MSMTFVRVLAGIPSWVAGRKCCRSGCPWCFPVMVAIELPGFQYSVFTLYSNRFKRKTVTHNLSIFGYFMWHDLWKIFSNLKKTTSSFWMGFHTPLLGWVDTPWGSLTESHVPNFPETWTWYLNHRVGCSAETEGVERVKIISGVFPSGPSWHVTAYFLSSSQHAPVTHTLLSFSTSYHFLNVEGRRHQLSQTKILHLCLPKTFPNQQSPRIHAFMFQNIIVHQEICQPCNLPTFIFHLTF